SGGIRCHTRIVGCGCEVTGELASCGDRRRRLVQGWYPAGRDGRVTHWSAARWEDEMGGDVSPPQPADMPRAEPGSPDEPSTSAPGIGTRAEATAVTSDGG